ncbi:MAG: MFS transporter [Sporolactobacillus sp.]
MITDRLKKSHAIFLTAIASGTILNPLNSSMIALALLSIREQYGLRFATVSWLVSGFYLISAIGQPAAGKMGDIIGRKKLFLIGLVVAGLSSLAAPFAPAFAMLLLMRLLQGAGSSAVYPSGVALVNSHVSKKKQASSLAALAVCASVMTAFGPTVGGFLIVFGGWQSIFFVNLPFILVSLVLGALVFPPDRRGRVPLNWKATWRRLDVPGILFFSVCIVCALWFLLNAENYRDWAALALSVIAAALFIWREWRVPSPFIDVPFIGRHRSLALVYLLFILLNVTNYCLFYGMPSFFESGMGLGVQTSGAMMLFMSVASVFASLISGRWIDRSGIAWPIRLGALSPVLAATVMICLRSHQSLIVTGGFLIMMGAGYGAGNVALQSAMLRMTPDRMIGTGSGLFQTCRYIGSISASAILGFLFGSRVSTAHFTALLWVMLSVSGMALLLSLRFAAAETLGTRRKR